MDAGIRDGGFTALVRRQRLAGAGIAFVEAVPVTLARRSHALPLTADDARLFAFTWAAGFVFFLAYLG